MDKIEPLEAERKKIRKELSRIRYFIKGSVMECKRTCGKPTCRCAKGQKHIAYYLSLTREGKTLLIYLSKPSLKLANKWSKNYKRLKVLIEKLAILNIQILKLKSKPRG